MGPKKRSTQPGQARSQFRRSAEGFFRSAQGGGGGRRSQQKRTAVVLHRADRTRDSSRYALRGGAAVFALSGQGIGAKASNFMKKRTVSYSDDKGEIIGKLRRIRDELPSLDEISGRAVRQTKVTIALDNDALSFFKREARRRNTSYQRMIRNLVRAYSQAQSVPD